MRPRVQELAYFMHHQYKPNLMDAPPLSVQFFDANHSMLRLLSWDPNEDEPQVKNPWHVSDDLNKCS